MNAVHLAMGGGRRKKPHSKDSMANLSYTVGAKKTSIKNIDYKNVFL
jgi:ribosomal protein L2